MKVEERKFKDRISDNLWHPNPIDSSNALHEDSIDIEIYDGVWELIKKLDKI